MMKIHRGRAAFVAFLIAAGCMCCARGQESSKSPSDWQAKLRFSLPLLGHRNWILIVDSAYPLQNSPGIEVIETGTSMEEALPQVIRSIDRSIHVRPIVYMDAELPFVPESDAPGVSRYRHQIQSILGTRPVISLPHEEMLQKVDEVSKSYKVLILKTSETIPYTSVFLQLNCKYWSDDAEARLRTAMKNGTKSAP